MYSQVPNWYSCDLAIHRFSLCMIAIPPPNLDGHGEEKISYLSGFRASLPTSSPSLSQVSVIVQIIDELLHQGCFVVVGSKIYQTD